MNKPERNQLNHLFSRAMLLLCFLVLANFANSQDTLQPIRFEPIKIKSRYTRNPVLLTNQLTAGKTTEKEKFDALFTWVVMHINYNYRLYNSGKPNSSKSSVKRILARQKGVCTDFAFLMDTLCELAGIPNETVTGYAKEINFDLNDTLYFDNHAWNAVKLNGLWYVYDATWCAGHVDYDYTRFGKWRLRCVDQLEKRRKLITQTLTMKTKKDKFCGISKSVKLKSVDVWILPFIPRVLRNSLLFFKFRMKETHYSVANSTYYLTNPEVFSINHFPNNPIWSLTQKINSTAEFSADSAYYNRHYTDNSKVLREGRFCLDCDNYYYADQIGKERMTVTGSLQNNPNNRFVPANYNLFMAEMLFSDVIKAEDSLTKMILIDSTINYLNTCKEELKNSRLASRTEYRFQMNKNRAKKNQLITENKKHKALANKILIEIRKRRTRVRSLTKKATLYERRGKRDYSKFNQAFNKPSTFGNYKEEVILQLKSDLKTLSFKSDSLTQQIRMIQDTFILDASDLWGNLLEEQQVIEPLANLFSTDSYFRLRYSMDNYERAIIEIGKNINKQEDSLQNEIHHKILNISDKVYDEFTLMNNLIKQRNALNTKSVKLMLSLKNCGQLINDSLVKFREATNQLMNEDICWNTDNEFLLVAVGKNFNTFLLQSQYFAKVTNNNNAREVIRFNRFNEHINRNKSRITKAIEANIKIAANLRKSVYDHRRSYLNKLRSGK